MSRRSALLLFIGGGILFGFEAGWCFRQHFTFWGALVLVLTLFYGLLAVGVLWDIVRRAR
jgi:hypothetical protein